MGHSYAYIWDRLICHAIHAPVNVSIVCTTHPWAAWFQTVFVHVNTQKVSFSRESAPPLQNIWNGPEGIAPPFSPSNSFCLMYGIDVRSWMRSLWVKPFMFSCCSLSLISPSLLSIL
jgi:hypothetical protein